MSDRTQALLLETPIKMAQIANEDIVEDARATRPGVQWKIDLERARLLTESYKQTEEEPMVIRRAKALANILDNMTIYTRPTELLVGNIASTPDGVCHYPEFQYKWVERETAPGAVYGDLLDEKTREEMIELDKYWKNLAVHHMFKKNLPETLSSMIYMFQWDSSTPNYEKILKFENNFFLTKG